MSVPWLPRGFGRIGFAVLILAGGLLAWHWFTGAPLRRMVSVDPVVGRMMPVDALIPMPGHVAPAADAQQQSRPHLVNLFASWCVPCRVEASVLATLSARGIRIDGIAVRDEPTAVTRFLRLSGDPFADIRLDPRGRIQAALGVAGLPETYIIDARGRILYRYRGALGLADIDQLTERLR